MTSFFRWAPLVGGLVLALGSNDVQAQRSRRPRVIELPEIVIEQSGPRSFYVLSRAAVRVGPVDERRSFVREIARSVAEPAL